jgi:hypothetical protein
VRFAFLELEVAFADVVPAQDDERRLAQAGLQAFQRDRHGGILAHANTAERRLPDVNPKAGKSFVAGIWNWGYSSGKVTL